jgi:hypothetical protein
MEDPQKTQTPSQAQIKPQFGIDSALLEMLQKMNDLPSPPASPTVYINQITVNITLPELKVSTPKKEN